MQAHATSEYALRLGDDALILAQRLCEWCADAPMLEEDIALANVTLDYLGARAHGCCNMPGRALAKPKMSWPSPATVASL